MRNLLKMFSLKKIFFYVLQVFDQKVMGNSASIFRHGCQNCIFTRWTLRGMKKFLEKKISRAKVSKLHSSCRGQSAEQFCFKKFLYFNACLIFSGNSFEFSKNLGCQNWNLLAKRRRHGAFFLEKVNSQIALVFRSENHRNSGGSFWAWLTELQSNCFGRNFYFFLYKIFSSNFFLLWLKRC